MKKLIFITLLLISSTFAFTQDIYIDDVPLDSIDVPYIRVIESVNKFNIRRNEFFIDYGQPLAQEVGKILNDQGKQILYYSHIGVYNILGTRGYKFLESTNVNFGQIKEVHHLFVKDR